ncbi:hypothetical protein B0H19DRAFT_1335506, partial [Mycena capillaripes]
HPLQLDALYRHVFSVRRLVFVGSFELDLAWKYPKAKGISDLNREYLSIVHDLRSAVPQYRQLTMLFLSNLTIDTNFRQGLSALPRLADLILVDCDISCRLASPFSLRHLLISGVLGEQTGTLFPLHIDGSDGDSVLSAFIPGDTFHDLVDLRISLTEEITALFFTFLQDCPRLEHLGILSAPFTIGQNLPSSVIPLYGPIFLAETFIFKRAVDTIELSPPGYNEPADIMHDVVSVLSRIARNSTPLRTLGLPPISPGLALLSTITKLFPELPEDMTSEFGEQYDGAWDSDADEEPARYHIFRTVSLRVPDPKGKPRNRIISEIDLDSKGCPTQPPTTFAGIMDWVCTGHAELPCHLRELFIRRLAAWIGRPTQLFSLYLNSAVRLWRCLSSCTHQGSTCGLSGPRNFEEMRQEATHRKSGPNSRITWPGREDDDEGEKASDAEPTTEDPLAHSPKRKATKAAPEDSNRREDDVKSESEEDMRAEAKSKPEKAVKRRRKAKQEANVKTKSGKDIKGDEA